MRNIAALSGYGLVCVLLATRAPGQAVSPVNVPPAYAGFQLPSIPGSLAYSVSASQTLALRNTSGVSNGNGASSNVSGNFAYLSFSEKYPFSFIYSGGYLASTAEEPSSFFHHISASQVVDTKHWTLVATDLFAYLPETPTTGLSGIPGLGDLGTTSHNTTPASQGVLTTQATRVDNDASATLVRKLTASSSIEGTVAIATERFVTGPSNNGLNSNQFTGAGGFDRRINARNSASVSGSIAEFRYPVDSIDIVSRGFNLQWTRHQSRKLTLTISAGPEWNKVTAPGFLRPSLTYAADANAEYVGKRTTTSVGYNRSINSGTGTTPGADTDTIRLNARRGMGRAWSLATYSGYARSVSLLASDTSLSTQSFVGSLQLNRLVGRHLSVYGSFTGEVQTTRGSATSLLPLDGNSKVLGFGLTYSPSATHSEGR